MRTWLAESEAAVPDVWALLSRPDEWSTWAPHVRGAWGLGGPEVRDGAVGVVRLLSVIPVPAKIVAKSEHSWTWRVGPTEMVHRVQASHRGCIVAIDLRAPGPLEPALAVSYGPIIQASLNRLARLA